MNGAPPGFEYPPGPHVRRHGPSGYVDYESYRDWLRDEFTFRCTYCLHREIWGTFLGGFDIDHFVPQANDGSLGCIYDNLLYLCHRCNLKKGRNGLPDPCTTSLRQCIRVHDNGEIEGLDRIGRKIIRVLALDDPNWVLWRAMLISTFRGLATTQPSTLKSWLAFPPNLPDLARRRPLTNSRPAGLSRSYFSLRAVGHLPEIY